MKHSIMRLAILYGLLSIFGSPLKAQDVSEEEHPSARVASIVTCNQGQSAQLADISACLGALKNSVGFPGPGQPNLNSKTEIIESLVEIIFEELGSGGDSVHIKIDILDSKIDLLQEELSIVDASLCSKLVRIEDEIENSGSVIEDIDSKIELLCSKVEIVDSQNDVIESKIDDINIDISISDATLCTKLLRVESKIDDLNSDLSIDDASICTKLLRVESKIDDLNSDLSIDDASICTKLLRVESKIDDLNGDISLSDAELCTKLLRVESKIDDLNSDLSIDDASICTKLLRVESKIDDINGDISLSDAELCTKLLRVESKIDDVNSDLSIDNALICTKLNRIESKIDVIDNELSLTDDSLCSKLIVIDSKVDVIDSITDDLHDTACIGRYIIRQSDLPFLIDASPARGPGLYSIGEPLTWAGPGAAISVTTDGVDIDFHCLNLDVVGSNATVNIGIQYAQNVGQCSVRNGRLSAITINPATLVPFTQPTILIYKPVSAADDALYVFDNLLFSSDAQASVPANQFIAFTGVIDIAIQNCRFFQSSQGAVFSTCSRVSIDNCLFERVFDQAISLALGQSCSITNSTFKICGQDIFLLNQNDTVISNCIHQLGGRMSGQDVVQANNCNTLIIKDCCNSFAGRRGAFANISGYLLSACINAMILRNAIDLPTTNGIFLNGCASCKVIDNSIESAGVIGIQDTAMGNLVLGNCVAFCPTNYSGVDANVIATGLGVVGATIPNANNRWINASF